MTLIPWYNKEWQCNTAVVQIVTKKKYTSLKSMSDLNIVQIIQNESHLFNINKCNTVIELRAAHLMEQVWVTFSRNIHCLYVSFYNTGVKLSKTVIIKFIVSI